MNNVKKTRFKITVAVIIYCMILGVYAIKNEFPEVTVIALGVIGASGVMYKHSETKRPSDEI